MVSESLKNILRVRRQFLDHATPKVKGVKKYQKNIQKLPPPMYTVGPAAQSSLLVDSAPGLPWVFHDFPVKFRGVEAGHKKKNTYTLEI